MKNLSPTEIWTAVLAVASAIVLLANAAEKIAAARQKIKAPNQEQNDRLDALEDWKKSVDSKLNADHDHLGKLDAGNRVTQLAILALLDHGIDGNNIEQMQHAKEELQQHLINR
ncbi:MAG: hypothetical protein IJ484_04000 [Oscillospiraceae bacterium]|nr:hypothetical protein [Oscillospiraceae bacterium]